VVFESDDWGSIRMPSRNVFDHLLKLGYRVDLRPFERYDSLEGGEDLNSLFDILCKYRDHQNKCPVFTANFLSSNPDFQLIKKSGFSEYFYEPFYTTYKRYSGNSSAFLLCQQGLRSKIFFPQFHGREHFNVHDWLKKLQCGDRPTHTAFEMGMVGLPSQAYRNSGNDLMIAYRVSEENGLNHQSTSVREGLDLFYETWLYKSQSFIAPCYTWNRELEKHLFDSGVLFLQGSTRQIESRLNRRNLLIRHWTGEQNVFRQTFLVRNCYFEPSTNLAIDWVDRCLEQIRAAFFWNKPAIISTHRLNYIGRIDRRNSSANLKLLSSLLKRILVSWPDVEFFTTVDLGNLITDEK
jgi:hypothetical protein